MTSRISKIEACVTQAENGDLLKMNPKRMVRRTRLYTVLGVIALASIIFLCFQLFSAKVLSLHSNDDPHRIKSNVINAELAKEDLIPVNNKDCIRGKGIGCKLQFQQVDMQEEINPKFKWVQAEEEKEEAEAEKGIVAPDVPDVVDVKDERGARDDDKREEEVEMLNYPRGIPYDLREKYQADAQSMFTCIHSKVKIPFSQVNDDYCDCPDSSDEPGTSACPDSKFHCQFQLSWSAPTWFSSSRVNDGVCDCCDGSDEWAELPLPDHVKFSDTNNVYRVHQVPCEDRCDQLRAQLASDQKLRMEGRKLQKEYIEAAKLMKNPGQLYGPNGVFYKLSLQCYEMHFNKYFYRVCPFSKVEQKDGPKTTVIGRYPSWGIHSGDKYELRMSNGDSVQCPESRPRTSVINFKCGLEDKVLSIHEFEVCEYLVEFITPAAC